MRLALTLSALALCSTSAQAGAYPEADPSAPCTMVTDPMLEETAALVEGARRYAVRDAAENYPDGAYAIYALYNLQTLDEVSTELDELRQWLAGGPGDNDPYAVNYSEAGAIMDWMRQGVMPALQYAQWYAMVSAVYHDSDNARRSAELSAEASLAGQESMFYAMQCFTNAYLTNF